jgi:DNA-binding MarR family transcriptional regulator
MFHGYGQHGRQADLTERTQLQLDSFLPAILRNMAEDITANMSRRYTGDFRLTVTEWRILLQLAEHRALTATQIVQYSAMEKSKVSRALSNLESRDLVTREIAEQDHRSKNLALTATGHKVYRAIVPRVLDWEKELLEGLETSEYRDLLFLLEKLRKQLRNMG